MIQFADEAIRPQVREVWKTVFGDPDDYMDIYFRHMYRDENTLVYLVDGKVVSSLQLLPYLFSFCGTEIPIYYIAGVSTLPEYRRRGYTSQLLVRSFEVAANRDISLVLLVPQEEWLLKFYNRYGFAQTFDAGVAALPSLKALNEKYSGDLRAAYREFDGFFRTKDMTVQKSFNDFCAVMEEASLYDFPVVKNLIGMARVVDAEKMLSLFAAYYDEKFFSIKVEDELVKKNNGTFTVNRGKVERELSVLAPTPAVDIKELAQLLLGYHTSGKEKPFDTLFPEKQPQIHFMLE